MKPVKHKEEFSNLWLLHFGISLTGDDTRGRCMWLLQMSFMGDALKSASSPAKTVSWFKRLVVGLSPRKPGFPWWFQWPRSVRHGSAAVRLLGSWVRMPPGTWICVLCLLYKYNNMKHNWNEGGGKDSEVQRGSKEETGREKNPGQSLWDLLCTKWHWDRLSSEYIGSFPVSIIPPVSHICSPITDGI
jgi:hypothetical protein